MIVTEQSLERARKLKKAGRVTACFSGILLIGIAAYGIISGFLGYFMLSFALGFGWLSLFEDVLRGDKHGY